MDLFNKKAKEVSDTAGKSEKSVDSLDGAMKALSPSTLAAVAGITALVGVVKGMTSAFKSAIDTYAHFESMQKGLEQFFQDADKGKEKFEELRKLSNETTFGVDELANSFTQLANVGVNVDTINDKLIMLGNIAGGSKEKFADLVAIYSKIQSTGRVGAMQLQQIASRGVPIYDTLKKIGVTGTATAKDITKAFEKLTTEFDETTGKAGQFYNAMNNINDTIEGKEGFIADYFKEMSVNFAEASGIADAYKSALDSIKNAIGWVSDALLKINENPVMKAIFQGLFVGAIGALVTVIITALIPALATVIAKLSIIATLKAIINPAMIAVGAGIGVVVGALAYLNSETEKNDKSSKKYVESLKSETEEINNQINALREQLELKNQVAGIPNSYEEEETEELEKQIELLKEKARLEEANNTDQVLATNIKLYKKEMELAQREVSRIKNMIAQAEAEYGVIPDEQKSKVGLFDDLEYAESQVKRLADQIEKAEKYAVHLQKAMDNKTALQEQVDLLNNQYKNAVDDIAQRWARTSEGQLDDLESQLEMYKNIQKMQQQGRSGAKIVKTGTGNDVIQYENNWTTKEIEQTNKILSQIESEVNDIKAKAIENEVTKNMSDYQKWLIEQLGINLSEESLKAVNGKSNYIKQKNGEYVAQVGTWDLLNQYQKKNDWAVYARYNELVKSSAGLLGASKSDELTQEAEALRESLNKLAEKATVGKDGKLTVNEEAVTDALNKYKAKLKEIDLAKMDEISEEYNKTMEFIEKQKDSELSLRDAIKYRQQLELGFTDEEIKKLKEVEKQQKKNEAYNTGYKDMASYTTFLNDIGETLAGTLMSSITNILSGSEYGNMIDDIMGGEKSGWEIVLGMFINAISKVLGGLEGINIVLNPLTEAFKELAPLLKTVMLVFAMLASALKVLFGWLMKFLDWLTGGFFSEMADSYDALVSAQGSEIDRINKLNEQYSNLYKAMVQQEEYYLTMKKKINSDSYRDSMYSVNDMILTPNGTFSTHPEDTILAMKHPEDLMNGKVVMIQPIINNNVSDSVDVNVQQREENGMMALVVNISKKVAEDVARGKNGWDNALYAREARLRGVSRS